jgi:DNA-binding GntR family transcriptional regulator
MAAPSSLTLLQPDADSALSLSGRAYYGIRELIVSLELAPGAPVSERELMERLGLGRTPVREALRTLAQEKLVEVYPRRGIVVSPVDVGDLASLSEARIVLESFAARLAAERANADDREVARALLAELPGADDEHDERALIELDQRIHRHIYRCAHNVFVESTLNEYYTLTLRIWFLALDRVARLDDAVTEHRELLEAVCDGDARRAEGVMRRHIESFERAIRMVL